MSYLLGILSFLFGLSVGSFLNVCIYRFPLRKSVVVPRSFCPACSRPIPWYDNIPVLSYLILGGHCRNCRAKISLRYPLVELLCGGLFVWVFAYVFQLRLPLSYLPFYWYLGASLLALSAIDIDHQIIPDKISYPLAVIGLSLFAWLAFAYHLPWAALARHVVLGALIGGGSLWLIGLLGKLALKKEAMGMGDVKLMAAAGIWLGWQMALFSIFLGALAGVLVSLVLLISGRKKLGQRLPFGPFLSIGIWISFLYGQKLLNWYLSFYRG